MRKWTLFLGLYFAICMLAACASGGISTPQPEVKEEPPEVAVTESEPPVEPDGLSALYLQVLDDLWKVDKALNSDVELIGLDLSATGLTEGERAAVALLFGERHSVDVVQGTLEDLKAQGYITEEENFPHWENGCLFVISEEESASGEVQFDAWKWRSALGAYFFSDCTAEADADGGWSTYTVGAQVIS